MAEWYARFWNTNPAVGAFVGFCAGALVLAFAMVADVAFVSYETSSDVTKQVGYLAAWNWSFTLTAGFPAFIYIAFSSLRRYRLILSEMTHRQMVASETWGPAHEEFRSVASNKTYGLALLIGIPLIAVGFFVPAWDWYTVVFAQYAGTTETLDLNDPIYEIDWSVAALHTGNSSPMVNLAFTIFAYTVLAVNLAFVFAYYAVLIAIAKTMGDISENKFGFRLIPQVKDDDERKGFQLFIPLVISAFTATLVAYTFAYLTRLQNLFLRQDEVATIDTLLVGEIAEHVSNMLDFDVDTANLSFANVGMEVFEKLVVFVTALAREVAEFGEFSDVQSVLISMVIFIVFAVVFVFVLQSIRGAAEHARVNLLDALSDQNQKSGVLGFTSTTEEFAREAVEPANMDVWPLRNATQGTVLRIMILGLVCFVFYRLAAVWIAAQVVQVAVALVGRR